MMCGLDIFMVIFDKEKQKFIQLNSDQDFDSDVVSHMLDKVNRQQFQSKIFTNKDFADFLIEKPEHDNELEEQTE